MSSACGPDTRMACTRREYMKSQRDRQVMAELIFDREPNPARTLLLRALGSDRLTEKPPEMTTPKPDEVSFGVPHASRRRLGLLWRGRGLSD
jgi:hypothetical protein